MLGWLLQQRQARHLTMELLKAVEGLLRATAADPALQRKVIFDKALLETSTLQISSLW